MRNLHYIYICERCGEINHATFFKSHKVGYRWGEKCETCSINLVDGVCAYTWHRIIFTRPAKKQKCINWRQLRGKNITLKELKKRLEKKEEIKQIPDLETQAKDILEMIKVGHK